MGKKLKELIVFRKDLVLQSSSENELEEREYIFAKTFYDENGNILEEYNYDTRGELAQQYFFSYDENGRMTEKKLLEPDGTIAERKTFRYNEEGKKDHEKIFYIDDSFDTVHLTYENDLITEKKTVDEDGDVDSLEKLEYQGKNLVRHIVMDMDNELVSEKTWTYDENNRVIESTEMDANEGITVKRIIEYYDSGNQKEVLVYHDDELVQKVLTTEDENQQVVTIIEENKFKKNTIQLKYDSRGNAIEQVETDRKGKLVSKVTREYDEQNRLISSDVFIDGQYRSVSSNYNLRHEYTFFD